MTPAPASAASPPATAEWPRGGAVFDVALSWRHRAAWRLWRMVRFWLFRCSPRFAHGWRIALLRFFGANIAPNVHIQPSVIIDFPWKLTIENAAVIQHGVVLDCIGGISIGANACVSQYSHLCTVTRDCASLRLWLPSLPIVIGRNAWIGADAFVGAGVRVGDRTVLGARASAFDDLPPDSVVVGLPARPVYRRQNVGDPGAPAAASP